MRVLIADRNARLLGSISRSFARAFTIETATSLEHCSVLLLEREFDLAIVSEKLADGPGLRLLAQIVRDQPDTLRVFAADQARLESLRGKLGPFGLFRTLRYPIDPRNLLATLTLVRLGLEIGKRRRRQSGAPAAGVAAPRPTVEWIRMTTPDATFVSDVPTTIASRKRRSPPTIRTVLPPTPVALPRPAVHVAPPSVPLRSTAASRAQLVQPTVPSFALAPLAMPAVHVAPRRTRPTMSPTARTSIVPKLLLLFAVATLVLLIRYPLAPSEAHARHISVPRRELQQLDQSEPVQHSASVNEAPAIQHLPAPAETPVEPPEQAAAVSDPPLADPASFGSEAYEAIYPN